jgi:CRP-like cAMP-binding protein
MKACFEELARQNKEIEIHKNILLLSKTKDKILAYLNYYSHYVKSNSFEIPYSREEFAIYLGVERSALSDTLSKMKKVGLIDYNRSNFKIKNID